MMQNTVQNIVTTASHKDKEAKLIAVLKSSDAAIKEKIDACRELAHVATEEAVEPLADLLDQDHLAHMARYGMETLPSPKVDVEFRKALGKLQGMDLVGVIGSVGVRRDTEAVGQLAKLLKSKDEQVAQAAARALGSIGTLPAAKALVTAKDRSKDIRLAVAEGMFRCGENLEADGYCKEALRVYDKVQAMNVPDYVKTGAAMAAGRIRQK